VSRVRVADVGVVVAEQLSTRPDRLFPPLARKDAVVARSDQMLDAFIAHINATSGRTGLQNVPPGNIRPHMFRRTMAMLTDQFPSEIALERVGKVSGGG
jgi:integrase